MGCECIAPPSEKHPDGFSKCIVVPKYGRCYYRSKGKQCKHGLNKDGATFGPTRRCSQGGCEANAKQNITPKEIRENFEKSDIIFRNFKIFRFFKIFKIWLNFLSRFSIHTHKILNFEKNISRQKFEKKMYKKYLFAEKPKSAILASNSIGEKS